MVLHVAADVQRLFDLGKSYPWPRPERCPSCKSSRLWSHGCVPRYFESFLLPLWIKRLRCPDCGAVHTLRPDLFYRRFRHSVETILSSLSSKTTGLRWLPSVPRQNQQYWFKGFRIQAQRLRSNLRPDMDAVKEIVSSGFIPASHSFNCAVLRL